MLDHLWTWCFRHLGGTPAFRIWGKGRREAAWRQIDVFASARHNLESRWPLWAGSCVTWTAHVIVVGEDFAERLLREQRQSPASRQQPVAVAGGRLSDRQRRLQAGISGPPTASEIMAHECGHTAQARRLGAAYLPVVGAVTLFREGPHWWNHFENEASESGLFGGLVSGSVRADWARYLRD
ncbi:MAG: hypothetical protein NZ700_16180 [Gemmataceae bacterium]|nr:hypothetical protein [Gemmataceae bacterium]MDW8264237.1 hypothetical protein [Gemmataceae bacterium]